MPWGEKKSPHAGLSRLRNIRYSAGLCGFCLRHLSGETCPNPLFLGLRCAGKAVGGTRLWPPSLAVLQECHPVGLILTPCPEAPDGAPLGARLGCAVGHLGPYGQAWTEWCLEDTARESAVFILTISGGRAEKVTLSSKRASYSSSLALRRFC